MPQSPWNSNRTILFGLLLIVILLLLATAMSPYGVFQLDVKGKGLKKGLVKKIPSQPVSEPSATEQQASEGGSVTSFYVYAGAQIVAEQRDGQTYYYHPDYLGTTTIITDSSGNRVYKAKHEPFGSSLYKEGDTTYTFTGKEQDNSGLFYYGAGYYDADTGRFTSTDPIRNLASPYAYAKNNPMILVDPNGMDEVRTYGNEFAQILFNENTNNFFGDLYRESKDMDALDAAVFYSSVAWDRYGYDSSRTGNPVLGNKVWYSPYLTTLGRIASTLEAFGVNIFESSRHDKYFKSAELSSLLCSGQSVCQEKAIFTAQAIRQDERFSQFKVSLMDIRLGKTKQGTGASRGITYTKWSGHLAVRIVGPEGDVWIVDNGNIYSEEEYINGLKNQFDTVETNEQTVERLDQAPTPAEREDRDFE